MSVQWGFSVLDLSRHAINNQRNHPLGVFKADCGHLLPIVAPMTDEPYGRLCQECVNLQPHPPFRPGL